MRGVGNRRTQAALGVAAFSMIAATACADPCSNTTVTEVPSPSGEFNAVVFGRDCGATTGLSTQVSLLHRGERLPNTGGNALTVDSGHFPLPLQVKAEWLSDRVLRLTYDPRLRTFTKESAVSGVSLMHASTTQGAASASGTAGHDALRNFNPLEFQRVERVAAIPAPVRTALGAALHDQPLGEPGSRWNATDVIIDKLPRRRLIFAGFSATSWFVYYEHGGIGHHEHVLLFSSVAGSPVLLEAEWSLGQENAKSVSELRAALERSSSPPIER